MEKHGISIVQFLYPGTRYVPMVHSFNFINLNKSFIVFFISIAHISYKDYL